MFPATTLFALAALWSATDAVASVLTRRATTCNGHAELCEKTYGTVTFVGAHNSYAVGVNNLAANQDQDVTQQLTDGIRLLQVQVHNEASTLQLCHSSCQLYNGGTLGNYLGTVKKWMDANPSEVITLVMVNSDNQPASSFGTVFAAAGMDTIAFTPETASIPASGWPTLGSMIDSGRRLVTFIDNQANFADVPYIMDEFLSVWETEFSVTTSFNCDVNRTRGDAATQMYMINHSLNKLVFGQPAPDPARANTTNAVTGTNSLGVRVADCTAQHSRAPNFLLVDFYEFGGGSVFEVAATVNSVTYSPTTPIATPKSSASGTTGSGGGSSSGNNGNNGALPISLQGSLMVLLSVVAGTCLLS